MSHWMIYWWIKLDDLQNASSIFMLLLTIALVALTIAWFINKANKNPVWKTIRNFWFIVMPLCVCFLFLAIFLPSTKQFAVIYLTPKVVNNEDVRELAGDGMKVMKHKLQQWLDENLAEGEQCEK